MDYREEEDEMANWPSYGKLLDQGFVENHESGVIRTPMESGPYKQARIGAKQTVIRPVKYWFTDTEYSQWIAWFRTSISRGADWFYWTDPVDNTSKLARIVDGAFSSDPEQPLNRYTVSFQMETYE